MFGVPASAGPGRVNPELRTARLRFEYGDDVAEEGEARVGGKFRSPSSAFRVQMAWGGAFRPTRVQTVISSKGQLVLPASLRQRDRSTSPCELPPVNIPTPA
ncbi:MAG TPA: hypothetical protein DCE44_24690 [Verrucomicrobiales bacterium]|nr:hypothetical protein [Verrucomicrobiales bacterium]